MQKSLFRKMFLNFASIMIISLVFLGFLLLLFTTRYFRTTKYQELEKHLETATALAQQDYRDNDYDFINKTVLETWFLVLGNSANADIFISDNSGQIIVCSEGEACTHRVYRISSGVLEQVSTGGYQTESTLDGIYSSRQYIVASPLTMPDGSVTGAVFVATSTSELNNFVRNIMVMFFIAAGATLTIAFIYIYYLSFTMVRPLRKMAAAVKAYTAGDFSVKLEVESEDEIGRLAEAFNNMTLSLSRLETMRSSFVANVSHELKTPMTVIGGFVDGMLDGTIPQSQHSHYLQVVSDEVKRLSRLTVSLLELARIEAGENQIKKTDFDITEIILETMFSFERAIEDKNIEVRGLGELEGLKVEADRDLVHQVVYNLIDNAVKFTPKDGYIRITDTIQGDTAVISVENSGDGIDRDNITHVFERFYKEDASRGIDKNGVGLGLYIVRSIINLHGGEIYVTNVPGKSCTFTFTVAVAKSERRARLITGATGESKPRKDKKSALMDEPPEPKKPKITDTGAPVADTPPESEILPLPDPPDDKKTP